MSLAKTRGGYKWATIGRTESGDDLGVTLWDHPPSDEEVDTYYQTIWPEEYDECDGVYWHVEEVSYAS